MLNSSEEIESELNSSKSSHLKLLID